LGRVQLAASNLGLRTEVSDVPSVIFTFPLGNLASRKNVCGVKTTIWMVGIPGHRCGIGDCANGVSATQTFPEVRLL
jgi:hypothetical protein